MGAGRYLELYESGAVHIYMLLRTVIKIASGGLNGARVARTVKASRRATPAKIGLTDGLCG